MRSGTDRAHTAESHSGPPFVITKSVEKQNSMTAITRLKIVGEHGSVMHELFPVAAPCRCRLITLPGYSAAVSASPARTPEAHDDRVRASPARRTEPQRWIAREVPQKPVDQPELRIEQPHPQQVATPEVTAGR